MADVLPFRRAIRSTADRKSPVQGSRVALFVISVKFISVESKANHGQEGFESAVPAWNSWMDAEHGSRNSGSGSRLPGTALGEFSVDLGEFSVIPGAAGVVRGEFLVVSASFS